MEDLRGESDVEDLHVDMDRGSACRRGGSAWGREDQHGDVEDLHGDVEDLHEDKGKTKKKEQATFT